MDHKSVKQKRSLTVALLELVLWGITLVCSVCGVFVWYIQTNIVSFSKVTFIALLCLGFFFYGIWAALSILLLKGANQRDELKVKVWLWLSAICGSFISLCYVLLLIHTLSPEVNQNINLIPITLILSYKIITLWIVWEFWRELSFELPHIQHT